MSEKQEGAIVQVGNILRLRTMRHYGTANDKLIWCDFSLADKKNVYVVLVLGTEPRDGSVPLDVDNVLAGLGYVPAPHGD